jgi:selenide,water dikinase
MPDIPGFSDFAVAAKPLGPFASRWRAFLDGDAGDVVVIGGGVAGVELSLTMAYALGDRGQVAVVEADTVLSGLSAQTRGTLLKEMERAGVFLIEGASISKIAQAEVSLSDGRTLPARLTVGAAGARPFDWLTEIGLDLTDGFITVDDTLRSSSHPHVYATGDCAHLVYSPRPKTGVFAVRAAPILTHNIAADLTGGTRHKFKPQKHYLKLITLGPKRALADKWNRSLGGAWAWSLKDRIDRAFMNKLNHPPAMKLPKLPKNAALGVAEALGPKPLCGGCGSKVGLGTLDRALVSISTPSRDDVENLPGDDAAVIRFGDARQVISTDHIRAFWNDPWLMGRIAAVHALNDVLAMGAAPQAVLAQIVLPPVATSMQETWVSEILVGASQVLAAEGASLSGGHTSIGSELTIGFTVTGLTHQQARTLASAREGDALILTGKIGSGTIMAAEMENKANGNDVQYVLNWMASPRGTAARTLAIHAHAMTDVTGFGLAGHVGRIAAASGLSAELILDDVPLFPGAERLAEQGIRSSIWAENRAAVDATVPDSPQGSLLFDPQTSGGFLASVPAKQVETVLAELAQANIEATQIGRMTSKGPVTLKAR